MNKACLTLALISYGSMFPAYGQVSECVMEQYNKGDATLTLKEIRAICERKDEQQVEISDVNTKNSGIISKRIKSESDTEFAPFVITPHRVNYFLPAITTNAINKQAYDVYDGYEDNLEDLEAKFQLSLKVPLNHEKIFVEGDGLYLGFTLQAWWQVYASNISKPFRETNYQPEIFYMTPMQWQPFGGNTALIVGFEHQSNGKAQALSRSWNRAYVNFLYDKDNFALSLRPWYRIKEDEKQYDLDPDGDDNPDIEDYLGKYELGMVYKWDNFQLAFQGRQNFSTNKGSAEVNLTFPLWGKLRGYTTIFSGYGESLIDYNHKQTRIGLGIALNNIL